MNSRRIGDRLSYDRALSRHKGGPKTRPGPLGGGCSAHARALDVSLARHHGVFVYGLGVSGGCSLPSHHGLPSISTDESAALEKTNAADNSVLGYVDKLVDPIRRW